MGSIACDGIRNSVKDEVKTSVKSLSMDSLGVSMTGQTIDRIYDKSGNLLEEIVGHNIVVTSFINLVMCLLKNDSSYAGITYWAVGSGDSSWDSMPETPSPQRADNRLVSEIGRMAISPSEITFLNEDKEEVSYPTNTIQICHTFDTDDCNGEWREFGIFGGNAESTLNSGIMINHRTHKIITKTSDLIVERKMRFTLNLV